MTQDLTEKFREIEKSGSKLILKISGNLLNIHGIGAERKQLVKSVVYEQTDIEKGSRTDEKGLATTTKAEREKIETVRTFPKNQDGRYIIPLGGDRGYFKGTLKASLTKYGTIEMQRKTSPAYGLRTKVERGVFFEPTLLETSTKISNEPDSPAKYLIQKAGMMPEYYDFMKSVPFEITIFVESDISEDIILSLLAFAQRLGIGPKRRGQIKIEKIEKLV